MNEVQNTVALVTGAGGGIGAATARNFALEGAAGVVLADIAGEKAQDQAASIEMHGLERLVTHIREIERALGDGVKKVYESELASKKKLRRVQSPQDVVSYTEPVPAGSSADSNANRVYDYTIQ